MSGGTTVNPVFTIIRLIGLFFVLILLFAGLIYTFKGNMVVSAPIALLAIIAFERLSHRLIVLKTRKTNYRSNTEEYATLGVYLLAFLLAFPASFHFLDIDFNRKDAIKRSGENKLEQLRGLNDDYEKAVQGKLEQFRTEVDANLTAYLLAKGTEKANYKRILGEQLGASFIQAAFIRSHEISPSDAVLRERIRNEMAPAVKNKQGVTKSIYALDSQLDREWKESYEKARRTFNSWNFFELSYDYNNLDEVYGKLYAATKAKMPDFEAAEAMTTSEIQMDSPMESVRQAGVGDLGKFGLLLVLLHLCILLPYLVSERPVKTIERHSGPYTNEGSVDIGNL